MWNASIIIHEQTWDHSLGNIPRDQSLILGSKSCHLLQLLACLHMLACENQSTKRIPLRIPSILPTSPFLFFLPLVGCSWDTACLHLHLSDRPRGCGLAVGAGCASQRGSRLPPAPVDTEPASHCRISTVCRQERHRQKGSGASLFATLR